MSSSDRGHFRGIDRVLLILRGKKVDPGEAVRKYFLKGLLLNSVQCWIDRNQEECVFKADSTACLVLWIFLK